MTYLDIVNNVLRRLREEEVTTVTATTYSKMVGDFVNDAKKLVETAWDWTGLRTPTIVVPTVDGTSSYTLSNSSDTIKVLDVINDTSNEFMEYRSVAWFNDKYYNNEVVSGSPKYYTFENLDASGDTKVKVYPQPDGVYSLRFNSVIRNDNLSLDSDTLVIPEMPVIHLSVALLARERGETGGTSTPEYFAIADKFLSDAIALDAAKHPDETTWYTP